MAHVPLTANFEENLGSIRFFLDDAGASQAFDELIDELFDTWIPNLERFPQIGRDLSRIAPSSFDLREHWR